MAPKTPTTRARQRLVLLALLFALMTGGALPPRNAIPTGR
jgi:hypothetical protein